MEKKIGLILGGIFLFSLVLVVGVVMAITSPTTATVTVNTFLSVTLNDAPITFPSMDPGTGPTSADSGNGFPLTATIGSESNVDANVGTKADNVDFISGSDTFVVSNMEWAIDSVFTLPFDYTTSDASVCSPVSAGDDCNIFHRLTIPNAQAAGTYNVAITITATQI